MGYKHWMFSNHDLKVEIRLRAVDLRAAQNSMKILLKNYDPEEWHVVEVIVI